MDPLDHVRPSQWLESLLGSDVAAYEWAGGDGAETSDDWLFPDERVHVERAVAKRRREFIAGRVCARAALAMLNIEPVPIGVGERRAPIWPDGITGSITHTEGYCAAVVTPTSRFAGVGIDAERRNAVHAKLEPLICTADEVAWLNSHGGQRRSELATLIFSAKETFYKCQYPLSREFVDFADARLHVDSGEFRVELLRSLPALRPWRDNLVGRYALLDEHVLTAMALPQDRRIEP